MIIVSVIPSITFYILPLSYLQCLINSSIEEIFHLCLRKIFFSFIIFLLLFVSNYQSLLFYH